MEKSPKRKRTEKKLHEQIHSGMKHFVPRILRDWLGVHRFFYHYDFQMILLTKRPPLLHWFVLRIELELGASWPWSAAVS
jgi:hypothetical protein